MSTIQFKRVKQYEGSFKDAVNHINALNLQPGEPFLCSYKENDEIRYFLSIGTIGAVKFFPVFSDFTDFSEFIKNKLGHDVQIDLGSILSEESDVEADGIDSEGKTIIKIKKDLLTNT
jgi:hypothetical protein